MSYHKDDGTTLGGILAIGCICFAFFTGYWVRDQGIRFSIEVPSTEQRNSK